MNKKRLSGKIIAISCIILILLYAFALFLPHSHESGIDGCAVCAFIKSSAEIMVATSLCFAFICRSCSSCYSTDIFRNALILHDGTPVWLRVKLSD